MGIKRLSNAEELRLVEQYRNGVPVTKLLRQYGFRSKKSVIDKVKKYYPNEYKDIIKSARDNRKQYHLDFSEIDTPFKAYFIGLMLTDGYVVKNRYGIQLTDEDCIQFIAECSGGFYTTIPSRTVDNHIYQPMYRIVFSGEKQVKQLSRYGITERKSHSLHGLRTLTCKEQKFLPYLLRGIIDGDGCIHYTSQKTVSFNICSMSFDFVNWIKEILEEKFFMEDLHVIQNPSTKIWLVESSLQTNIFKLMALVYDRPYGMRRKFILLREMFRDYNKSNQQEFIWNVG